MWRFSRMPIVSGAAHRIRRRRAFAILFLVLAASSLVEADRGDDIALKSFLRARCGPTGNSVWVYKGALYDPLNGKKIANVQGLELVRLLAVSDSSVASKERYRKRCRDLSAAESVGNPQAIMDYAGTVLSRKLFCYTAPDSDDSNDLLKVIRLRPNSPKQEVPLEQAATVYDTATTFVQRNGEWIVHSEWPDGRAFWTTTNVHSAAEDDEQDESEPSIPTRGRRFLEFTSYARPQPLWRQKMPDLTRPPVGRTNNRKQTSISPHRSALVQFGSSGDPETGKYGARETYHYNLDLSKTLRKNSPCNLRYTRYGEGPIWYGPGRMCTLELSGRRVSDWKDSIIPRRAAQLALEKVVGFLSVNSPVPQDDVLAGRAVDWFRGRGSAFLQIAPDLDESSKRLGWLHSAQDRIGGLVERFRSATSLSIGGASGQE